MIGGLCEAAAPLLVDLGGPLFEPPEHVVAGNATDESIFIQHRQAGKVAFEKCARGGQKVHFWCHHDLERGHVVADAGARPLSVSPVDDRTDDVFLGQQPDHQRQQEQHQQRRHPRDQCVEQPVHSPCQRFLIRSK